MDRLSVLSAASKELLDSDDVQALRDGLAMADEATALLPDDPDRAAVWRSMLLSQLAYAMVRRGAEGDADAGYQLFHALLSWDLSRPIWGGNLDKARRDHHLGRRLDATPGFVPWLQGLTTEPPVPEAAAMLVAERPDDLDELLLLVAGRNNYAARNRFHADSYAPGRVARLALLLRWGARLHARYAYYDSTVAHHLAKLEDTAALRFVASRGADVNAVDKNGKAPLAWVAERKGCGDTVRCLVELGADIDATSKRGRTALFDAAYSADAEVIATFAELGANLDHSSSDEAQFTALEMSARSDNRSTAQALLAAGATPTAEALSTADDQLSAEMCALLRAAMAQRGEAVEAPADSLDDVARRLGELAARWADDSGEYDEYMAGGGDGADLIVEQYWEAQFADMARAAVSVATATARGDRTDEELLNAMKKTYREALLANVG